MRRWNYAIRKEGIKDRKDGFNLDVLNYSDFTDHIISI